MPETNQTIPQAIQKDCRKEIKEALINDKHLNYIYARQYKLFALSTPMAVKKDDKVEIVWIDSENNKRVDELNELINARIEQITKSFN